MDRRQFISTASSIAAGALLAGCSGLAGRTDGRAVSETVVENAPETTSNSNRSAEITETNSDAIGLNGLVFQRAGQRGLVVAGNLANTGDRPLVDPTVEVTLYDERQDANTISRESEVARDRLEAGATWQWAAKFEERAMFETDYYAVTGRGELG